MNTNLPLVPQTNDGLMWSNGWAQSGVYLDMIGKQHKKDHEQEKKGARTGLERGQEQVLKGAKTGFDWHHKSNPARFKDIEMARTAL